MDSRLVLRPAKITPPQLRKVLERTHLLAQLERGRQLSLIMLITHAGGGKTMLAADFVRRLDAPVAWYSLETGDNDFTQFGAYLVEAIRRVAPEFGDSHQEYIFSPTLEQSAANLSKASVIATTLVERLASAFTVDLYRLKDKVGEFWIVLDDYQFAQSPANNYFLQQVVRELPPDFHLLLLSRELPEEFPFAEFLVNQRAEIIGVDQFRFTLTEIESLLAEQFGELKGAPDIARQIYEFTKGWAVAVNLTLAGLEQTRKTSNSQNLPLEQIATNWLQQIRNPRWSALAMPELINEPLFNYLASVLFNQQPPERQLFLLQTSVLDALSEEACDWVMDQPGTSREHLAALERQYLFLSRLDSTFGLYQYHVLIKTFLQFRLGSNPELARQSYTRAASLNERDGHYLEALDFYLKAQEHSQAVNLLSKVALTLYERGQTRTLNEMIRLLPDKLIQKQPNLLQVKGMLAQEFGRYDEARLLFQEAAHLYELSDESDLAAKARADAAFSLIPVDAYTQAQEEAGELLNYPLSGRWSTLAVSMAHLALGLIAQRAGRFEEAEQNFQYAEKLFQGIGDKYRVNVAISTRAGLYCSMGQFIKAKSLFQRTLPYWERSGNLAREAYAYYWLALILRRTGKYSEAIAAMEENLERLQATGYNHLEPYALHELAICYRELGDYARAEHYFSQTESLIKARIPLLEIELLADWGLNYWLQGNRFRALELYEEGRELVRQAELPQKEIDVRLALGLTELDRTNFKAAIENLQGLLELLEKFPNPVLRCRALLLLAATYSKAGKKTEAISALLESLQLAKTFFYDPYLASELDRSLPLLHSLTLNETANISEENRELLEEFFARHKPEVGGSPSASEEGPASSPAEIPVVSKAEISETKDRALIELRALQGGKVYREGIELSEWKWPKARALIFFLAEKQGVTMEQIQAEFWSESNEVKANTVYSLLSELRKAVQPLEIKSKNKRYSLPPDSYYYDAREFEQRARSLLNQKSKASLEELEGVLSLHQSEFLDNLSGQWVEERRQSLINLYISLAMILAQLYFSKRDYRQAIDTARRVLHWDHYFEEAHKIIIACYRGMGQESQARRQQQIYDEALEEFEF